MLPAYEPCTGFGDKCNSMVWAPEKGHIPRGYCGATNRLADIRLLLICAEPGDPHLNESHIARPTPEGYLNSAYDYAWKCFAEGKDQFHRNIRKILNLCFPNMSFEEQMKYSIITDAVLCSAKKEGGRINSRIEKNCAEQFLVRIIEKLPSATIAALGKKAQSRLERVGVRNYIPAFAAAPPGCNFKRANESWNRIAERLKAGANNGFHRKA